METGFKILAGAFGVVAAWFLWQGNFDGVFVTAVLAAVSFFISIRFQVKKRLAERAAAEGVDEGDDTQAL